MRVLGCESIQPCDSIGLKLTGVHFWAHFWAHFRCKILLGVKLRSKLGSKLILLNRTPAQNHQNLTEHHVIQECRARPGPKWAYSGKLGSSSSATANFPALNGILENGQSRVDLVERSGGGLPSPTQTMTTDCPSVLRLRPLAFVLQSFSPPVRPDLERALSTK